MQQPSPTIEARAAMAGRRSRVVFTTPTLMRYRVGFHERVRALLLDRNVEYTLIYGAPNLRDGTKADVADLDWGTKVSNTYGPGIFRHVLWQPYCGTLAAGDLVVLPQENRVLSNYVVQMMRRRRSLKVALWGHGRNFQSPNPDGMLESWKRFWAVRCDWWFTYTEGTAATIARYGFPAERITAFQNAVDTSELRGLSASVALEDAAALKRKWGLESDNVGVYVGGLYHEKRIAFLLDAAETIRRQVPNFVLAIVGSGPDRHLVEAAVGRDWIRYFGPRFGREKVEIMKLARVFLMPGAMGLAVLDSFAVGLPMIAASYPFNGPEIAYLKDGENGFVVHDWRSLEDFSARAVQLLRDAALHARLSANALESSHQYSIENMAQRFVGGALRALALP